MWPFRNKKVKQEINPALIGKWGQLIKPHAYNQCDKNGKIVWSGITRMYFKPTSQDDFGIKGVGFSAIYVPKKAMQFIEKDSMYFGDLYKYETVANAKLIKKLECLQTKYFKDKAITEAKEKVEAIAFTLSQKCA